VRLITGCAHRANDKLGRLFQLRALSRYVPFADLPGQEIDIAPHLIFDGKFIGIQWS
jgi:hypothetical protein